MLKKTSLVFGMVIFTLMMSGCNGGKGDDFVGRWSSGNHASKGLVPPSYYINIKKDKEVFHVDVETTMVDFLEGGRKTTNKKYEGKAESDTVLSMMNGLLTMRLQGDRMFFGNDEYVKLK